MDNFGFLVSRAQQVRGGSSSVNGCVQTARSEISIITKDLVTFRNESLSNNQVTMKVIKGESLGHGLYWQWEKLMVSIAAQSQQKKLYRAALPATDLQILSLL